ncbi:MAG: diheme cytochrome c [Thiobacillaceae bacterium]|nr:diheme cytochrome c [Thiobacillaceae bacterium]
MKHAKPLQTLACLTMAGAMINARADRLPLPGDTPPSYRAECGGCHLAFPPALLAAADWRRVMDRLGRHYGTDASLDDPTRQTLRTFLERHGNPRLRAPADKSGLPKLTATAWFRHEHGEVPARLWHDARVKSPANCIACHRNAEAGNYSEQDLALPELRGKGD